MAKLTRTSCYNPKMANQIKRIRLIQPFDLYTTELQKLVDQLLYVDVIPKFFNKDVTDQIKFPARLSQVVAKQASAITRSIQAKVKLAQDAGNKQKYQQEILNKYTSRSLKIDIKSVNIELDSRFVDIQPNKTSKLCDYWIKITSFPSGRFYIPLKLTNHMKDLVKRGYELKTNALRVHSNGTIGLYFNKEAKLRAVGISLGVDMGRNKIISTSDGSIETTHKTSVPVKQILALIKRRKSNSNSSKKSRTYLKNQINYSLKHDINWVDLKQLVIEDLSDIKTGNKWGKTNQHWRVGYAQDRLKQLSEENDVRLTRVNAAYTSQICSVCGFKDKNNRSGEKFLCLSCDHEMDADINAAINIHNRGIYSSSTRKPKKSLAYESL